MRAPLSDGAAVDLTSAAARLRHRSVQMVAREGFGYLGQALSSAEQLVVLFLSWLRPGRDHFVLSPAHYMIAAYAVGVEVGLLEESELGSYGADGSQLEAVGTERSPVVDMTCGSLGQGLSAAIGFAIADQLRGSDARTFAFLSDGELEEGQVWEAAMFAAHRRLRQLVVLLDCNDSQVDGPVSSVTTVEPVAAKWESFGWRAFEVDGHDVVAIDSAIAAGLDSSRPSVVISRTSTRHGLSCLPADADGHFIKLPADLADRALTELDSAVESARPRRSLSDA